MRQLKIIVSLSVLIFLFSIPAKAYKTEITVAKDGSGDFTSIQEAVYSTKAFPDKPVTIFIKKGVYKEKVRIPAFNTHLSLIGEDVTKTIISWDDYFKKINKERNSTFYTYTLKVEACDFYAENLTIENTAGKVGQAVALHVTGDRIEFHNCRILGNQDTLYSAGESSRQYFSHCYIEGTTDFIFGEATALFNKCTIHSLENSYITAASTPQWKKFGFVFLNCRLTAASGVCKVYLGRPWRNYANVAFLNCRMGKHIRPEGWANWSGTNRTQTAVYYEYGNTGPGYSSETRVEWSHQLTEEEASCYTIENIINKPVLQKRWSYKIQ